MLRVALVAAALAAGCAGGSQGAHPTADMSRAMPADLEATTKHEGDVRAAKVRVYADADFRARTPDWKKRVTDEIDYANQLLTPLVGVRLDVVEVKEWDHAAPDAPLRETLAALVAADAGDDVTWVIAYTSPTAEATSVFDELGTAELLGRHVVVRGHADDLEKRAFMSHYPDLPVRDAGDVLDARRRHEDTCVLLHQLGHTLGAIHETDPAWLMHPAYDPQQATLSERNRELMQLVVDDRMKIKELRDPDRTTAAVLAAIEKADWGGWIAAEREDEVNTLRAIVESTKKGETAPAVPPEIYDQYVHADKLAQQGRQADARAELEPMIAAYPGNAQIRLLACKVELAQKGAPTAAAVEVCGRAAELAQGDPGPYLTLAAAFAAAGDKASARAQLAQAATRIGNLKQDQEGAWASLAADYQQLGDLTHAEDAAAKAGHAADAIAAWARRTRVRYGAPRDGAKWHVTADDEADYVDTVRKMLDLVYASKYGEVEKLGRSADKKWPGAPGIASARCDLAVRKNEDGAALAQCKAAIAAAPDDSWALYLYGVMQLKQRDQQPGIATLKKAIAADPELAQAWRALAKALANVHADADLARLRTDYQAAFGQPLGD